MSALEHGYPFVTIQNSAGFDAHGVVEYRSLFCKNDKYEVKAHDLWRAPGRGVCLVTKISAVVTTPDGPVDATPYLSTGTSYAEFVLIKTGPGSFQVIRPAAAFEDQPPADYVEPTVEQK